MKRGQVTIFIILAIVIVGIIIGFFLLKDRLIKQEIPIEFKPVEEKFLSCIEDYTKISIEIAESQAGYVYLPEFEPGSTYKPFSSQLNFLGMGVPYWYYISGNNIIKEQIPSKQDIQQDMNKYIEENIKYCRFDEFYSRGYNVEINDVSVDSQIEANKVKVSIKADLKASLEDNSVMIKNHNIDVNSKLGKFYSLALKIYNSEKSEMFLEEYAVDVLRLYAPVDGVEITCMPKVWLTEDVVSELVKGLESNIQSIKLKGDYYKLKESERKYFVADVDTDEAVNFIYSKDWPISVDIEPADEIMIAEPVGNQEGLGLLGFCYVPYHFVYDLNFPVLIQIYDNNEMFQFPIAVVISGNEPRESLAIGGLEEAEVELCRYMNQKVSVYTYDSELNPVEAEIKFKCLSEICDISRTSIKNGEAILIDNFPQCLNGYIIARADGFSDAKYLISTNREIRADILLSKLYDLNFVLKVDDKTTSDRAFIYFKGPENKVVVWPDKKSIELSEGMYNISVYVYKNTSISVPASSIKKCVDVPKPGLLGIFGATSEQCFDLNIPAQTLDNALVAGGKAEWYITESELKQGKTIEITSEKISIPKSIDELQDAYNIIEYKNVYLDIK